MSEPVAGRPHMPGYGVPEATDGALPWEWARTRLVACRNYFLATTRPDGRPHVMPVWGLWLDEQFAFSTAVTSRKSRNLANEPRCVVTVDDGHRAVIVEGTAALAQPSAGFHAAYTAKYGETIPEGPIWVVRPTRAFAFQESEEFASSATRWTFA